ncbi:MAG: hypothetical protein LLG01_03135 [Planctomycetaceae bacterium]|nr:hypothetical protein [Planctomycetaceae bacterium]
MKKLLLLGVAAVMALPASGDTIFLRDGRTFDGKITQKGDDVKIDIGVGVITVKASEVLHIRTDAPAGGKPPAAAATAPATAFPSGGAAPGSEDEGGIDIAATGNPEPIAFTLMRRIAAAGAAPEDLAEQLRQWRIAVHDRHRKVDGKWVTPSYFVTHREAFNKEYKNCQDLARRMARLRIRTAQDQSNQKNLSTRYAKALRDLAGTWGDAQIRRFLLGVAEYHSDNPGVADGIFRKLIDEAPQIAAYHQGCAMALLKLNRPLEALEQASIVLQLRPHSQTALNLVREAMKATSGADVQSPIYVRASAAVNAYEKAIGSQAAATTTIEWLMPDARPWQDRDKTLPIPACDRLVIVQAPAVPIGQHTLMVDETLTAGAAEIVVRLGEGRLAPASLLRVSYSSREKPLGVAMLHVEDAQFTPLTVPEPPAPARPGAAATRPAKPAPPTAPSAQGRSLLAYGLGYWPAMGATPRIISGHIAAPDADKVAEVTFRLAPGEAAAPIIAGGDTLEGFMLGRLDAALSDGGPSTLLPASAIAPVLARAKRSSGTFNPTLGYARLQRKIKPEPAEGKCFIVYAIKQEKME